MPGVTSPGEKAGKRILENSVSEGVPAGFVPNSKLYTPWAPSGVFEEHSAKVSTMSRSVGDPVMCGIILNRWHSAF